MFVCVSVVSVSIDEEGSHCSSSEDEADNHATSSPLASPSPSAIAPPPLDTPCHYPSPSPYGTCSYVSSPSSSILSTCGLERLGLASPCNSHEADSVCSSGHVSPLLGPRSQCSGASSPDCDRERGLCSSHPCVHVCWLVKMETSFYCGGTQKKWFSVFWNVPNILWVSDWKTSIKR